MERRELLAATGALAVAAAAGCVESAPVAEHGGEPRDNNPDSVDHEPDAIDDDAVPDGELEALALHNAAFGLDIYHLLAAQEDDESLFLSPYSISLALAMTYAGASGETAAEMAETLRFDGVENVHELFGELDATLEEREETEDEFADDEDETVDAFILRVANALWKQEELAFAESYREVVDEHYGAELNDADFAGDPGGERERINEWVAETTEDRIDELLPAGALDPSTVLVLANAIYFMASWENEFDPDDTEEDTFENLDGSESDVEFMHQNLRTPYAEVDGAQAVELPYVGGEVSMVVILPDEVSFEEFETALDAEQLFDIFESLSTRTGDIVMPKFEVETKAQLSDHLEALGMERAFGSGAELDGIFEGGGSEFVDEVYHDAVVTVDEEGTEAAAATAVVVPTSAPPDWGELRLDRPFMFCIRDRPTNAVLFLGRVTDLP